MKTHTNLRPAITAVAVAAAFGAPASAAIFNDSTADVAELQQRLLDISDEMQGIEATAKREKRELTTDEQSRVEAGFHEFETIEARIDMARRRDTQQPAAAPRALPRKTESSGTAVDYSGNPNDTRAQAAQREQRRSVPAQPRSYSEGSFGFRNAAEYLATVMTASAKGGVVDPRLIANAPTEFGREAVGSDGGYAVPPDFRETILSKVMGEASLLSRTDQMPTSSNAITMPADQTTPWQSTGGIQAYWENEAGQKQQSKPALGEISVKANKIIALVPLTDELLEDAPSMAAYVNRKAPEKIDYKVNEAIIKGTGAGQPLGILSSPGTVVVPAESGQTADTVVFNNIVKMHSRLAASSRPNSIWIANADIEAQLLTMVTPGNNPMPAYLPPGGLSASPYGTLMGRPVITSEAMPALGDAGDLILGDMKQYLTVIKSGGIRQDVSIHVWFDYDITAFRFVLRIGGQPYWNSPIERTNGQSSRGFFVALGART